MVSTSQPCFVFWVFFPPHRGSPLHSVGTLLPGIKVNEVSLVPVGCNEKNPKTSRIGSKWSRFVFICFSFWLPFPLICTASRPVENRLCQAPVPNRSQLCQIPCPIDCEVSPWGAWGPCTFENCDDQAGKKGTEALTRETRSQQRLSDASKFWKPTKPSYLKMLPCSQDLKSHDLLFIHSMSFFLTL